MQDRMKQSILIATLGTEPQVVTSSLDLLLKKKEAIQQVVVLHTVSAEPRIAQAVSTLHTAFKNYMEIEPPISLSLHPMRDQSGQHLADINSKVTMDAAFREIYLQVHQAKRKGYRVHICVSGGRKPLSIYAATVSQMLFDEDDCLWYLHSSGDFLESKSLHPREGDDTELVQIPVVLWGTISPMFTDLSEIQDPLKAIDRIQEMQLDEKLELARTFLLGSISLAQKRVVDLLVKSGASDAELAEKLNLSPRTVEEHLRSTYKKAAFHWGVNDVNRTQLVSLLRFYYSVNENA